MSDRFITMPLRQLRSPDPHPEVTASPLQREIGRIRLKCYSLVLTHQGEVLGFWMPELPETVPVRVEQARQRPLGTRWL